MREPFQFLQQTQVMKGVRDRQERCLLRRLERIPYRAHLRPRERVGFGFVGALPAVPRNRFSLKLDNRQSRTARSQFLGGPIH